MSLDKRIKRGGVSHVFTVHPIKNKFLKIVVCKELPQWMTFSAPSALGAYHPYSRTIYIKRNLGITKFVKVLFHELCHWFVDFFLRDNKKIQHWLDRNNN